MKGPAPAGGDAGGCVVIVKVGPETLDGAVLMHSLRKDSSGALACFVGVVRDEHLGRRVHHLLYEAYPPMAEKELASIASRMQETWRLSGIALAHRIGRLEIGEASVVVAVSAPHRREALEACAFGIEQIKQRVPIWKKEFGDDGEAWVIGDPGMGDPSRP